MICCSADLLHFIKDLVQFKVISAEEALSLVRTRKLNLSSLIVIQHGLDKECRKLIDSGAVPFMLMMLESPLYAGEFYDQLESHAKDFLFVQVFSSISNQNDRRQSLHFPSFSLKKFPVNVSDEWESRKFSCMVVANKFLTFPSFGEVSDIDELLWFIGNKFWQILRPNPSARTLDMKKLQLQEKRLDAIRYFSRAGQFDLYGRGWKSVWKIPPKYRDSIKSMNICPVEDKISVLNKYKFNFCFENVRYPGYITEKIFDAMVANTIPIYWGAPDVADFIPPEIFIDASRFSSFEELHQKMSSLAASSAYSMLSAAKEFLFSNDGIRFSKEGVASSINQKLESYINDY